MMTNKEQIIIDEVGVLKEKINMCFILLLNKLETPETIEQTIYEHLNAFVKEWSTQLARKTQECEELKKTVLTKCPNCNSEYLTSKGIELYEENKKLKKECEELKRKLSNQEQLYQNEIEIYNKSCLQLRQENDDLYLERLALNTANSGINALLEVKEQESNRYRKALEEIEGLVKNFCKDCGDYENCNWDKEGCYYSLIPNLKDIINKAKE